MGVRRILRNSTKLQGISKYFKKFCEFLKYFEVSQRILKKFNYYESKQKFKTF